jgi:NAD(P)-dependent dehydrogenase (short-subunit alcohol dehydrogenase family)
VGNGAENRQSDDTWRSEVKNLSGLMDLRGRRALVTGASGALGRVIVETLAELGADLVLVDRPGVDFHDQLEMLSRCSEGKIDFFNCDLELQDARDDLVRQVLAGEGRLDILINNAAFVGTSGLEGWALPFEQQTVDTWRRALEVNLTAVFDLSRQFVPTLRSGGEGVILNVGSIYGVLGPNWDLYADTAMANPAAYAASKGGVVQLTRWLATTLAPLVRVNCICPGGIARGQPEVFVGRYEAMTPMGRMATEEDFRGAFAFLASPLSRYVTGQVLMVDGGWSAW